MSSTKPKFRVCFPKIYSYKLQLQCKCNCNIIATSDQQRTHCKQSPLLHIHGMCCRDSTVECCCTVSAQMSANPTHGAERQQGSWQRQVPVAQVPPGLSIFATVEQICSRHFVGTRVQKRSVRVFLCRLVHKGIKQKEDQAPVRPEHQLSESCHYAV